jgi:hypothetical protein
MATSANPMNSGDVLCPRCLSIFQRDFLSDDRRSGRHWFDLRESFVEAGCGLCSLLHVRFPLIRNGAKLRHTQTRKDDVSAQVAQETPMTGQDLSATPDDMSDQEGLNQCPSQGEIFPLPDEDTTGGDLAQTVCAGELVRWNNGKEIPLKTVKSFAAQHGTKRRRSSGSFGKGINTSAGKKRKTSKTPNEDEEGEILNRITFWLERHNTFDEDDEFEEEDYFFLCFQRHGAATGDVILRFLLVSSDGTSWCPRLLGISLERSN